MMSKNSTIIIMKILIMKVKIKANLIGIIIQKYNLISLLLKIMMIMIININKNLMNMNYKKIKMKN